MHELEHRINFTSELINTDRLCGKIIAMNASDKTLNEIVGKLVTGDADWSVCTVGRTLERARVLIFSPKQFLITSKQVVFRLCDALSTKILTFASLTI